MQAAEKIVGWGKRIQPEWFADNVDKLALLIKTKNEALDKMLRNNLVGGKKEFRWWQRRVKKAVDKARADWILKMAKEAEEAVQDGRTRWEILNLSHSRFARRY